MSSHGTKPLVAYAMSATKARVGATLAVALAAQKQMRRFTEMGRHKGVPYIRPTAPKRTSALFLARPRPGPWVETRMEQNRLSLRDVGDEGPCRGDPCGRPRRAKADAPVHRDGTPQGRPLHPPDSAQTYIRVVPCASAARPLGWKFHALTVTVRASREKLSPKHRSRSPRPRFAVARRGIPRVRASVPSRLARTVTVATRCGERFTMDHS